MPNKWYYFDNREGRKGSIVIAEYRGSVDDPVWIVEDLEHSLGFYWVDDSQFKIFFKKLNELELTLYL